MKVKSAIKVTLIVVEAGLLIGKGVQCLRRKLKEQNKSELERNFEAFKAECMKSNEAAMRAVRLMNELQDQIDEQMGIDPMTINVKFEEVATVEAGG